MQIGCIVKFEAQKSPLFWRVSGGGGYLRCAYFGNVPNTVSESTVSNTELSEFFLALTEFRGENSVSSSQPIICVQSELTEFFAELTEFAVKLSEAQRVLFSETVLSKQYSDRSCYSLRITVWDPFNLAKSPIFINTPCKSTCLYNPYAAKAVKTQQYLLSKSLTSGAR